MFGNAHAKPGESLTLRTVQLFVLLTAIGNRVHGVASLAWAVMWKASSRA